MVQTVGLCYNNGMIVRQAVGFLIRALVSAFGMWLCVTWFGSAANPSDTVIFVFAGVVFALLDSLVKPVLKLFALPLAIFTLGLSTLLINIAMVALTIYLIPGISMDFIGVVLTSLILSLINSVASFLIG